MRVRSIQGREAKMDTNVVIDRKIEAAILSRVVARSLINLSPETVRSILNLGFSEEDQTMSNLSPETARSILNLGFSEEDHARVHELTTRNQDGALSAMEKEELMHYVKAGNLLALLQSKARKFLKDHRPD
jgi:hypothetical protein